MSHFFDPVFADLFGPVNQVSVQLPRFDDVATGPPDGGLWIEQLWFDQPTTELITGRAISTLKKFCKRHEIEIHTIPGESVDGDGHATTDHRRVRSFILHSEYLLGSIRAAKKGER